MLLHILTLRDNDWWIAQCLEYDLGAEAKSPSDLRYEMAKTIAGQVALDRRLGRPPFSTLDPAPAEYQAMPRRTGEVSGVGFRLPDGVPPIELCWV